MPLPSEPLQFRLISSKVIEVYNSQGKKYFIEQNEGSNTGGMHTPIVIARQVGQWILL